MLRSNEISEKWNFEIRMETAALHLTKVGNVETSSRHGMAIARTQMERMDSKQFERNETKCFRVVRNKEIT